ncbi:HNH endonuclease [Boseongicola sp. H5]|uniref:HNH endonuclease n=1 Tax=Boseongicola sp. H5 TaxID=2763261 RepID=UPI002570371B|nr:HNH endonuclease [Boseongicola sp. H5]
MAENDQLLLLKIGEKDCPEPFYPNSGGDWEGEEFRFPSIQRMPDATTRVLPQGTTVFVWTHHNRRKNETPGQGLTAIGHLSDDLDTKGAEGSVRLIDVQTLSPAISLKTLKSFKGTNAVIHKARNYTLRHALVVDGDDAKAFRDLVETTHPPRAEATADYERLRERANRLRGRIGGTPPSGNATPPRSTGAASGFVRSPEVVAYVQDRANGVCELCGDTAPFLDKDGFPFLEVHHVRFLAHGGPDVIQNAAALCPNCHRACHHSADPDLLRRRLISQVGELEDFPAREIACEHES